MCLFLKKIKIKTLGKSKFDFFFFLNALIVKKENKNGDNSFRFWEYMVLEKWYQNYLYATLGIVWLSL